jgi:hypothetical protein
MKPVILSLTILIAATAVAQQPATPQGASERVWTWSEQCKEDHKLGVTIRLAVKVLYEGVLPICHGSRDAENGRAEFHFAGGHLFQGRYRTRSTDSIEGNVWQAGGESDVLILGISFDTGKQVLLNTTHVARPNTQTSSELDKGISITTYPVPAR